MTTRFYLLFTMVCLALICSWRHLKLGTLVIFGAILLLPPETNQYKKSEVTADVPELITGSFHLDLPVNIKYRICRKKKGTKLKIHLFDSNPIKTPFYFTINNIKLVLDFESFFFESKKAMEIENGTIGSIATAIILAGLVKKIKIEDISIGPISLGGCNFLKTSDLSVGDLKEIICNLNQVESLYDKKNLMVKFMKNYNFHCSLRIKSFFVLLGSPITAFLLWLYWPLGILFNILIYFSDFIVNKIIFNTLKN